MSQPIVQDSISVSSLDKAVVLQKVEMASSSSHSDHPPAQLPPVHEKEELAWSKVRTLWQDAFSEFLGTMTLILFGDGVVAQVVLSKNVKGEYQSISWGWG